MGFTLGTVFNEGTDWEFTVSQETLAEAVAGGGITEADIGAYCYTAFFDARIKAMLSESSRNTIDGLYPWAMEYCAAYNTNNGAHPSKVQMNMETKDYYAIDVYERNFLIWEGTINNKTGQFLVMDIADIKKWCMDCDNGTWNEVDISGMVTPGFPSITGKVYTYTRGNARPPVFGIDAPNNTEQNIYPCNVVIVADDIWIGSLNPSSFGGENLANQRLPHQAWDTAYSAAEVYKTSLSYVYQGGATALQAWIDFGDYEFPDPSGNTTQFSTWNNANDDLMVIYIAGQYGNSQNQYETVCIQGNTFQSWKAVHKVQSWCGLLFKHNNVIYKPIIEGGIITGFTSDMDIPSEWDDMTNVTGNNISPTPPSPGPTPGYDDDPWNGVSFSGVGVGGAGAFARCYYMTSTELANLRSWMGSINVPEGFDPMAQIIGLSQVPVALSGDAAENIQFINSSAVYDPGVTTRVVDSGVSSQYAMGLPIKYNLGSVNIARRMQERGEPYLDYDCQIELYLPLIGMFSLDTQAVMGRTITAEAILDPISGTLAAYAYVSRDGQNLPIAYGSTTIGVDLPISAQQYSVSRAALKQANAQLGASLLSGALTMLAAASSGKASGTGAKTSTGSSGLSAAGIREAGSDYMKASQVGNVFGDFMNWGRTIRQLSYGNNTAIAGSFGGSTAQWSYPFTPYVKIIRPRYEKPSNYAHSQGVPCVQTKTIGSCTGFIQCIGVDVSGISGATDLELQAIQAALSNGIYAGGGQ